MSAALSVFTSRIFLHGDDDINLYPIFVVCVFRLDFSCRRILIPYHLSSQCMLELCLEFAKQFEGCSFSDAC